MYRFLPQKIDYSIYLLLQRVAIGKCNDGLLVSRYGDDGDDAAMGDRSLDFIS